MLVRFLSYAASVIGARRYKPMVIAGLVLLFSITSITIVAGAFSSGSPDAASHAGQENAPKAGSQQSTTLNGLEKKAPKENTSVTPQTTEQNKQNKPNNGQNGPANPATDASTASTPLEITLNATTVSLSQNSGNTAVAMSATGSSTIQWSVTSDTSVDGLSARIESSRDNTASAVIRFATNNVTPGTYQFTITAKDSAKPSSASKTILVTIS